MKKRFLSLLVVVGMLATLLVGCGGGADQKQEAPAGDDKGKQEQKADDKTSAEGSEIALITDVGTIDDKSFNQGTWEGVEQYGKETGKSYKYYKPTEKSDQAYITSIELAIKGGAKVIVCPGFLFEVPIFKMQSKYPDVKFILVDGVPHDVKKPADIKENTQSILYAEEEAGFLAGYAAVKDGYTKLGFMGGMAVPAVVRYGYGFVQGADYAAKEMKLEKGSVDIKYTYLGAFNAAPEIETKASSWYSNGTDVIFACAGGAGNSVMKAAEKAQKFVIGVDVDQSNESEAVITSSMKNLKGSVYDSLKDLYDGKFHGGKVDILGADTNNVLIAMDTARFKQFKKEDYEKVYKEIVDKKMNISKDDAFKNAAEIPTEIVKVEDIK